MTLNRESRLVRWAYLWESRIPDYTNLCALFWRVVWLSPVKILSTMILIGLVLFVFGFFGWLAFTAFVFVANIVQLVAMLGAVALFLLAVSWWLEFKGTDLLTFAEEMMDTELAQGAMQMKRGICPIIELKWK